MRLERTGRGSLDVIREDADRPIYKESSFFHALKNRLLKEGFPCINRLMEKDGHMVSSGVHYVRSQKRNWTWCLWDGNHQIQDTAKTYREDGKVSLLVEEDDTGFPFQLVQVEGHEREQAEKARRTHPILMRHYTERLVRDLKSGWIEEQIKHESFDSVPGAIQYHNAYQRQENKKYGMPNGVDIYF